MKSYTLWSICDFFQLKFIELLVQLIENDIFPWFSCLFLIIENYKLTIRYRKDSRGQRLAKKLVSCRGDNANNLTSLNDHTRSGS